MKDRKWIERQIVVLNDLLGTHDPDVLFATFKRGIHLGAKRALEEVLEMPQATPIVLVPSSPLK